MDEIKENNEEDDHNHNEDNIKEDEFFDANDHFVDDVHQIREQLIDKKSNEIKSETSGWFGLKSVLSSVTSQMSGQKADDDSRVKEMIISIKDETKRELQIEEEVDEKLMTGSAPHKATPEDRATKLQIITGISITDLIEIL